MFHLYEISKDVLNVLIYGDIYIYGWRYLYFATAIVKILESSIFYCVTVIEDCITRDV